VVGIHADHVGPPPLGIHAAPIKRVGKRRLGPTPSPPAAGGIVPPPGMPRAVPLVRLAGKHAACRGKGRRPLHYITKYMCVPWSGWSVVA